MDNPEIDLSPSNAQAERSVLGAVLLSPNSLDEIIGSLNADDFFFEQNQRLFDLFVKAYVETGTVDLVDVVERLRSSAQLEICGGEAYLAELMSSCPTASHVNHYARIVSDNAERRRLIRVGQTLVDEASDKSVPTKSCFANAETKLFSTFNKKQIRLNNIASVVSETLHVVDAICNGERRGLSTGFYDVDSIIGGLRGSEFVVVAARPAMGKSAFASNIAVHVALTNAVKQNNVLYVSLEMNRVELATRMISGLSGVTLNAIQTGRLNQDKSQAINDCATTLASAPIEIDDCPSRTIAELTSICRRQKRAEKLDLVVIDYIGLIEPSDARQPRQQQVAEIARRLKCLAKELDVPILCLAQLNRDVEQSRDNRPKLSNLRESGAIEQDADVVMLLHRPEYYMSKEEAQDKDVVGKAEVIVAKNRNGRTGTAILHWEGATCSFQNLQREEPALEEFSAFEETGVSFF